MARQREGRVRIWDTHAPGSPYPEDAYLGSRPRTGVCFSGGGTRSYVATIGQLRGLTHIGLIPRITYISAVSGGAWAAAAYTYYQGSGRDDGEVLGLPTAPDALSLGGLSRLEPHALGHAAARDFSALLHEANLDPSIPSTEVWSHTIGRTFLEPFGLFDPAQPVGFTLDPGVYQDYLRRNPAASPAEPHVVRDAGRPYLLVHAALTWPADGQPQENRVGFEMSPLAVGTPHRVRLQSAAGASHRVGGGYVETLAFGCDAPSTGPDADGLVTVRLPDRPFTLAQAVGASSAFSTAGRDVRTYPHVTSWPVTGHSDEVASTELLTDGGDVENYGLIPLLRRRVTSIVVFINTVWPLDLGYDPAVWPPGDDESPRVIDPFLAPLFGAPGRRCPHNSVFPREDFAQVVSELQTEKRAGRPLVSIRTHAVQPNDWWGVAGGWEVRVCWVYNDRVDGWEERLSAALREALSAGRQKRPEGPVARFPHYLTRGQNRGSLIELTPIQINLLGALSCWAVTSSAARLERVLG